MNNTILKAAGFGWIWKVRALINGVWSGWSLRTFNVEPVDTDPPVES